MGFYTVWADPVTREVEFDFDFDSNHADIAAGATAVTRTFFKNARVTGSIYVVNGTSLLLQSHPFVEQDNLLFDI